MAIKDFVPLHVFAKTNKLEIAELLHLACLGKLALSLPFYGTVPTENSSSLPDGGVSSFDGGDNGVFDLHVQDVQALAKSGGEIMVEHLFSKCGQWSVRLNPPQVVKLTDVVVRADEAAGFNSELDYAEPISDSERSRLLRQIGAMAMFIASTAHKYKKGDKPNASQIAEAVDELLKTVPDLYTLGLGNTNLRNSVKDGIELLQKLK